MFFAVYFTEKFGNRPNKQTNKQKHFRSYVIKKFVVDFVQGSIMQVRAWLF